MIDEPTAEAASLYVFELLEPAEAHALARRMEKEPELRALVDELTAAAAALARTAPARRLPPALETRVLAAVRPAPKIVPLPAPRRSGLAWAGWALAACLAVGCLLLWSELTSLRAGLFAAAGEKESLHSAMDAAHAESADLRNQLAGAQSGAAELRSDLADARSELVQARSHDEMNELRIATLTSKLQNLPDASAVVVWDEQKQRGVLRTKKLPAPPADHDYQLWVIDADHAKPVDGGAFSGAKESFDFHPGSPVKAPKAFAISLEAKGGVPEAKGPIVLVGE